MGRRLVALSALAVTLASLPSVALAHEGRALEPHDLWSAWDLDPVVSVPLLLVAILYTIGTRRVWRRSTLGRSVRRWEAVCFAAGWIVLVVALVSPLHALGGVLFSAHMTQHELIMVVAAPLLVVGRPLVAYIWGLPRSARRRLHGWLHHDWLQRAWRMLRSPIVASVVHAVAVVFWHLPDPYQATLRSDLAHGLQHVSFFASALLFWWAMLAPRHATRGQSVVYLFATTLWTGALGALLTFAPGLWYPDYAATTGAWGLTPLEDQQLGGIIMWIPGGTSYLVAALGLLARWLAQSEGRSQPRTGVAVATWRSA